MALFRLIANIFYPRTTVLGRAACLGTAVFKIKYSNKRNVHLINQQKVRVDLLLGWLRGEIRPQAKLVEDHLLRKDVYPLIEQQEYLPGLKVRNYEYLLMDSFAELTDQKFMHRKEGWSFCCHYSDINHTREFDAEFESCGLLPIDRIEKAYNDFFNWFEINHAGKNVIFIHYPSKLDNRDLYKKRGKEILEIMQRLEQIKPYIHSIFLDDESLVDFTKDDNFPYHYATSTNFAYVDKWKELENNDHS
jgi:hypothetical protein